MYLSENRYLRIYTLCSMYVAQGIPFGFVTITLIAYLSGRGMDANAIGSITAMSALPWAFKWIWGPVIDRFRFIPMGNRRPWIIIAQLLMALTLLAMIAIPDMTGDVYIFGKTISALKLLCYLVFINNCFAALQDVAVDALAVDLLEEKERGQVNGFMYASSYLGAFIGGACMGRFMAAFGLRTALVFQFGMLIAIMMGPLLFRERPGERLLPWTKGSGHAAQMLKSRQSTLQLLTNIFKAFSMRSSIFAAVFAITTYLACHILANAGAVYFIQEMGWAEEQFTDAIGGYGVVAGLVGSIFGGFLADKLGAKKMIAAASVLLGLAWIGFCFAKPYWIYRTQFVVPFFILEALLLAILAVSFFSLAMTVSWPKVAATQFTAYMACMNLSKTLGLKLAGPIYDRVSFEHIYLTMGIFQIAIVALLLFIDPHQTRRVLGDGEEIIETENI
ncbi:MAG: MFS transporter [Anaerohalosphaera sp.]|nr:MFS transporter [Anaerohalosphaera sp.]